MMKKEYRRFCFCAIAVLLALSVYLLINAVRTAYPNIENDAIDSGNSGVRFSLTEPKPDEDIFGSYEFASAVRFSITESKPDEDIFGCYEFADCIFMNPLSSFMADRRSMPYVYGLGKNGLIIANIENGDVEHWNVKYEKTFVQEDELASKIDFGSLLLSDLSQYKERWLRAACNDSGLQYNVYQMDGEIWLAKLNDDKLWSVYRLQATDKASLEDLERAWTENRPSPGVRRMTLNEVYALARKGDQLKLDDFKPFTGKVVGSGFLIMRYDIVRSGCVLFVHSDTADGGLNYARLSKQGYDTLDEALTVDIREGAGSVAAYLNPLYSLMKLKIEDPHGGTDTRELIYEYDGYRYYLNTTRADKVFITIENGDRLPLKQALEDRRVVVEDLVANGLFNIYMEPVENPMGGYFPILHHLYTFTFDKEAFYPSASFMYLVNDNTFKVYFGKTEFADILEMQGRGELAEKMRQYAITSHLVVINEKTYLTHEGISELGITMDIGWAYSSHTPVEFSMK